MYRYWRKLPNEYVFFKIGFVAIFVQVPLAQLSLRVVLAAGPSHAARESGQSRERTRPGGDLVLGRRLRWEVCGTVAEDDPAGHGGRHVPPRRYTLYIPLSKEGCSL